MRIAIIVHAFYRQLWPELMRHISNFSSYRPDLYVTISENASSEFESEIKTDFPHADVKRLPNHGFDIGPFIEVLERINLDAYDLVVKLHTKRNRFGIVNYMPLFGGQWRRKLLAFCSTQKAVTRSLALFSDPKVGMVGNGELILHPWDALVPNPPPIDPADTRTFVAGTMFIVRADLLKPVRAQVKFVDFEPTTRNQTGSLAHEWERRLGYVIASQGSHIVGFPNQTYATAAIVPLSKAMYKTYSRIKIIIYFGVSFLREYALRIARLLNAKTSSFNGLKRRLGLYDLASKVLVGNITAHEVERVKSKLRTSVVQDKIYAIHKKSGADSIIHFYILFIEKMGDISACEPFIACIKRMAPNSKIHWLVKPNFRELLDYDERIDEVIEMPTISSAADFCKKKESNQNTIIVNCLFDKAVCPVTGRTFNNPSNPEITAFNYYAIGNLQEAYFYVAGLPPETTQPAFHFKVGLACPPEFGDKYILFHCQSDDSTRNWDAGKWNLLAETLFSSGHVIVEVGISKTISSNSPLYHDYTGRKSLQQIAWIIKHAKLFVGVDSGFAHFANATSTPSVILLGKYKNFNTYCPYAGEFSRSAKFATIHAKYGDFTASIPCEQVICAVKNNLNA